MASPRGQLQAPDRSGGQRTGGQDQEPETNEQRRQRLFHELRTRLSDDRVRSRFAAQLPAELRSAATVERFCESIFSACRDNPKLLTDASWPSLLKAAERVAKRGLTVGQNIAWLVPYKGEVQDQLGYMGAVTLAMRSGSVAKVSAQAVYENDRCTILLGTEQTITHSPPMKGRRGAFLGVYAIVWMKGFGGEVLPEIEWIDADEIEEIRQRSPGKDSPAWRDYRPQMGCKIVLKRALKKVPSERAMDLEDMDDRGTRDIEGVAEEVGSAQPPTSRKARAAAPALERSREEPMDDLGGEEPQRETVAAGRDAKDERTEERQAATGGETKTESVNPKTGEVTEADQPAASDDEGNYFDDE